jgi:hypothetical protein
MGAASYDEGYPSLTVGLFRAGVPAGVDAEVCASAGQRMLRLRRADILLNPLDGFSHFPSIGAIGW